MKQLLSNQHAWFPVWSTALLMLCMICIYLPVFSGDDQKLSNFPLIVVDEDKEFASSEIGKALISSLTEEKDGHSIHWKIETSEQKAIQSLKENKAYGALIIPANFSQTISTLATDLMNGKTEGTPAEMKVLINEGGGQMATSLATNILQSIASSASSAVSNQLKDAMVKENLQVSPLATSLLNEPIHYTTNNVLGLSTHTNKGMTPFMMVLIASITGLMGAQMINGYLNGIGQGFKAAGYPISDAKLLISEMLLGLLLGLIVSASLQLAVFGIFGSAHSTNIWYIFLFTLLICLTMFSMFKMIGLLFGQWGMLIMFPVNIMGIFASGGAIPLANLPEVHRVFSLFLPTRYMVDGMRSLLFYDGNMESGLKTALLVICTYFVLFLIVIFVYLIRYNKNKGQDNDGQKPGAASVSAM